VDESAEEIPTLYVIGRVQRRGVATVGRGEVERAVRPLLVVMPAVDTEHVFQVAATEDQDPVEALGTMRSYPAFSVSVRVWRVDRGSDHPHALGAEDLVECVGEFRVPVVYEEPEAVLIAELDDKVARLLCDPAPSGFAVEAMYSIRRVASEMKNST
jgi:hypothetical protein